MSTLSIPKSLRHRGHKYGPLTSKPLCLRDHPPSFYLRSLANSSKSSDFVGIEDGKVFLFYKGKPRKVYYLMRLKSWKGLIKELSYLGNSKGFSLGIISNLAVALADHLEIKL